MCGKKHVIQITILSKQTFFDEKISALQKETKQMNIDRTLRSHVTAVRVVFINSSKIIYCVDCLKTI